VEGSRGSIVVSGPGPSLPRKVRIEVKGEEVREVGVLTASLRCEGRNEFLRVEGSRGSIVVSGPGPSLPRKVRIEVKGEEVREVEYEHEGMGFHFEADSVALDVIGGRKESSVVPLEESVRMMRVMDQIRKQGGVVYPQDKE